jgi:hypothetical protein
MNIVKVSKAVILLLALQSATQMVKAEQVCDGETETTPSSRFSIDSSNSDFVVDTLTGLAWARCVVGQTWNEDTETCSGEPLKLTWQEALENANTFQLSNHTDWRLPNLKELVSIVERQCVEPAKNTDIFPNSPDDRFWTSTPDTSADGRGMAWAVGFYNGRIDSKEKYYDFYVRMVRYAE